MQGPRKIGNFGKMLTRLDQFACWIQFWSTSDLIFCNPLEVDQSWIFEHWVFWPLLGLEVWESPEFYLITDNPWINLFILVHNWVQDVLGCHSSWNKPSNKPLIKKKYAKHILYFTTFISIDYLRESDMARGKIKRISIKIIELLPLLLL